MSALDLHLGLQTLDKNEKQVLITIRNNLDSIALYLREAKIIDRDLCREVTNPDALQPDHKRAKKVYDELVKKVEEHDARYSTFIECLHKCETCDHTISVLESTFYELKKENEKTQGDKVSVQPHQGKIIYFNSNYNTFSRLCRNYNYSIIKPAFESLQNRSLVKLS